jgi:acylphosphatase
VGLPAIGAYSRFASRVNDSNRLIERREIYFSGRVQGVGFRYTTRQIAARYPVSGFVKNLADGRVELVIEGPHGVLDEFVGALEAEMGRYISDKDETVLPGAEEFRGFEVRR